MVDVCFVDDSRQKTPRRPGMGPLVAAGAIIVPGDALRDLELGLTGACARAGFPAREEFKWHPAKGSWMATGLTEGPRERFFVEVLRLLAEARVKAIIVVEDESRNPAISGYAASEDVTTLLFERINADLRARGKDGLVVVDRPGGRRADEDQFLASSLDLLAKGTPFVTFTNIALNALSTDSKMVRCLQAADLITSSTTAYVSGEDRYSPPIFAAIKPLLSEELGRIGGVGLKLHPDFRYGNLYHWLLGDEYIVRYPSGIPLPIKTMAYACDATTP